MLGWLLLGALITAAVITICVSFLNKQVAKDKLRENNIKKGFIKEICKSSGITHIKLDAIDTDGNEQEVDIEADDYDENEIYEGMTIIA